MTLAGERGRFFWSALPVAAAIAAWEIAARCRLAPGDAAFPPFSAVLGELWDLTASGVLAQNFFPSLRRVLIGLAAGAAAGILAGAAIGWKRQAAAALRPILSLLYPIPALGWLPLLMIWIGLNEFLPVAVIFICSFFPICYTTASSIEGVDRRYVQAAQSLGASDLRILATVVFPLALPGVFTGLRLETGMAWRVIIAAEMVAIPTGIGAMLIRAESLVRADVIMACLAVLSIVCLVSERLLIFLERRLTRKWR